MPDDSSATLRPDTSDETRSNGARLGGSKADGRSRPHDIERTRAEILQAALEVFAEKGLTGARVDDIAARTHTAKPTIYYHFRSKEELYAAVLENAYGGIRDMERTLELILTRTRSMR